MYKLKPRRQYTILELLPESNYICHKVNLEGALCKLTPDGRQIDIPTTTETTRHVHHARVKILTGKLCNREILLTHFAAHIVDKRETCTCDAYPFPHTAGGGKCRANDEYGYKAWCGHCGKACIPKYVDEGIGSNEAYGIRQVHHDWVYRSHCCGETVFGNAECTEGFSPDLI